MVAALAALAEQSSSRVSVMRCGGVSVSLAKEETRDTCMHSTSFSPQESSVVALADMWRRCVRLSDRLGVLQQ